MRVIVVFCKIAASFLELVVLLVLDSGSLALEQDLMKTFSAKAQAVSHQWYVVDATEQTLGRFASQIAKYLRGKHKPEYTPHVDTGDYIVVLNAEKIAVTGKKMSDKIYYSHSGFPGGLKAVTLEKLLAKHPTRVIEHAVKGMLPKNPLGRDMFRKLKIYVGSEHPHGAQQPQVIHFDKDKA